MRGQLASTVSTPSPVPPPFELAEHRDADGNLLPLKRKPGRPRRIRPAPTADERAYIQQVNAARDDFVEADDLVRALDGKAATTLVLDQCTQELAVESAALAFEVRSANAAGRTDRIDQIRSKRIDCLHKLALIELTRRKLGLVDLDPSSEPVRRVLDFFLLTIDEAADATLTTPQVFKSRCRAAFEGWAARFTQSAS